MLVAKKHRLAYAAYLAETAQSALRRIAHSQAALGLGRVCPGAAVESMTVRWALSIRSMAAIRLTHGRTGYERKRPAERGWLAERPTFRAPNQAHDSPGLRGRR